MKDVLNRLRAIDAGGAIQRALKHADRSRGIYPELGELARRYGEPPDLTAAELRVFSQNGEDGVIAVRRGSNAGSEIAASCASSPGTTRSAPTTHARGSACGLA